MGQKAKTNKYNDFLFLLRLPLKLQRHKPETIKLSKRSKQTNKLNIFKLSSSIIQPSSVATGSWLPHEKKRKNRKNCFENMVSDLCKKKA